MFRNREDAALRLAERLKNRPLRRPVVLAIPRGGVAIGATLARALGASQARYPDLWPMFRGLGKRPVLALRGGVSDVLSQATFDRMAREKPDLLHAVIPGVGHVPALDEKESILALDDFFARI